MTAAEIETRPLYGIGTVARLANIKPDTLRVWERRYGLGASHKSKTGRRLYTRTDLEHLQIIARLVDAGFRIGEIAAMERKTLEAMLGQGTGERLGSLENIPRIVFVGHSLCGWVDQHQGLLAAVDCQLLRCSLQEFSEQQFGDLEAMDLLVLESAALNTAEVELVNQWSRRFKSARTLVYYQYSSDRWTSVLTESGVDVAKLPLDSEEFSRRIRQLKQDMEADRGVNDTGELAGARPRLFNDRELVGLKGAESQLGCGCSQHLSGIIESLVNFETYSSNCAVENWGDAATHACVYAYTSQARWLMEKALRAVLEEKSAG
jgi:DNA-binding transcriptional MerR regulator